MSFGPTITTQSPLVSAIQGQPYSSVLNGTGGAQPYTYALVSGTLDSGLTLNSNGTITGTPLNAEVDLLGIQLTDANGAAGPVQLFILTTGQNLFLVGETLPSASNGIPYSQNIAGQASGGTLPYVFSLLSATGSDTWFVSAGGVITGTPGQGFLVTDTGISLVTDIGTQLTI